MDLNRYRKTASGGRLPGYVRASRIRVGVDDLSSLDTQALWELHDSPGFGSGASLLDVKTALADRIMDGCVLCERRCGADRNSDERGFCGVGKDSRYFFENVLWGEERPLVPSHEVFMSGCNMRCGYCYSFEAVLDTSKGKKIDPEEFARIVERRKGEGATNLNLIGGEPTVHISTIFKILKSLVCRTAIVWNSNFLMSAESMKLLAGVVDLFVGDFRFGNDGCARKIAETGGYAETAKRNYLTAAESGDLIIRHLLVPGHVDCCLVPIAEWVAKNLPETPFNLMFQYTPYYRAADDPNTGRFLTPEEEKRASDIVESLKLNTKGWDRPIPSAPKSPVGTGGEMEAVITIRPDGRVVINRLHGELLDLVDKLRTGD